MAYNVYRNGMHIAYCKKKDFRKEWFTKESEYDTFEVEEEWKENMW